MEHNHQTIPTLTVEQVWRAIQQLNADPDLSAAERDGMINTLLASAAQAPDGEQLLSRIEQLTGPRQERLLDLTDVLIIFFAALTDGAGFAGGIPGPSASISELARRYQMGPDDVSGLREAIESSMARAYRETMTANARVVGFGRATGKAPTGADLRAIREYARFSADSVSETWNQDIRRQLEALNATGQNDIIASMKEWAERRARWKAPQIALDVDGRARQTALDSFISRNGLQPLVILTGPPPREEVCAFLMAMEPAPARIMREYPAPIHIGCPHVWEIVGFEEEPRIERVFVG